MTEQTKEELFFENETRKHQLEVARGLCGFAQQLFKRAGEYYATIPLGERMDTSKLQFTSGTAVSQMDLFDIIELFVDWIGATKRHNDGDIFKSIKHNQERFGISPPAVPNLREHSRT